MFEGTLPFLHLAGDGKKFIYRLGREHDAVTGDNWAAATLAGSINLGVHPAVGMVSSWHGIIHRTDYD